MANTPPPEASRALNTILLLDFGGYVGMTCVCLGAIAYLRRHRSSAFAGDTAAARKVLLPSFEPLLWALGAALALLSTYLGVTSVGVSDHSSALDSVSLNVLYWGRRFVFFLVIAFLLQPSVSLRALGRATAISITAASLPLATFVIVEVAAGAATAQATILLVYRVVVILVFGSIAWRVPTSRASPRALREYCSYVMGYFTLLVVYTEIRSLVVVIVLVLITILYATLVPVMIYRLLRADTQYWRGLGDRAAAFGPTDMHEIVSAQGLHVLLDMHQSDVIDFCHLDVHRPIGVGAHATVCAGVLHASTPVAIKVYTPPEISPETLVAFSQEAAVTRALCHPNIVTFYGLCVCPPSICLVSELCRGSLDTMLTVIQARDYTDPLWPRVCYMLDAARAVAHLHSFHPPFLHRDIKPANFMVDTTNRVKLADFGESRSMATTAEASMTIRGSVEYMAPEVLLGRQGRATYTEAADVYSVGMTFWDICHPSQVKYPGQFASHLQIHALVLDGHRPPIDPSLPPTLQHLIAAAWAPVAADRPTAAALVKALEQLLGEMCATVNHILTALLPPSHLVAGDALAEALIDHGYAFELEQAVRLGHALMDAGCLHHAQHDAGFEPTPSALYVFDLAHIELCTPWHTAKASASTASSKPPSVPFLETTSTHESTGSCYCRHYAQGFVGPSGAARPRLFPRKRRTRWARDMPSLHVNLLQDVALSPSVDDLDGFAVSITRSSDNGL